MTHFLLAAALSLRLAADVPPASPAPCTCKTAVETNGWCDAHHWGYVAGVRIPSAMVYEVLDAHGHTLDLSTFTCSTCRKAIDTNGFCEEHRTGFVERQVYFSRLTYELARGEPIDPGQLSCRVCKRHSQSHGWCEKCQAGIAGPFLLVDQTAYRHVARAIAILSAANDMSARCADCAVAVITDTECPRCRITYKDGKPAKP